MTNQVNPDNASLPVNPNQSTPTSTSPPIIVPTTKDTIESVPVSSTHFSLLDYLASVDIPSLSNQLQMYKNEQASLTMSSEYYNYIAHEMVSYQGSLNQLNQLNELQNTLVSMAQDLNALIGKTFSQDKINADNAAVKALNDATQEYLAAVSTYQAAETAYKNGEITEEEFAQAQAEFDQASATYNAAVNTYNAYAATRNADIKAYNDQAEAYNAFLAENLDAINAGRTAVGLTPSELTYDELKATTVPYMPTAPTVPAGPPATVPGTLPTENTYESSAPPLIDTTNVNFGDALFPPHSYSSPLYLLFTNLVSLYANEVTSASAQRVIKELYNNDVSDAGLPDAYIEPNVSHQFSALLNQTAPIATGGGSYQFPYELANNVLQGGVSVAAYNEIERSLSNYFPGEVATGGATGIATLVRAVIHYSASGAIPPAVTELNQVLIQRGVASSNLAASLISIGILRKVVADISSGVLNGPVATIIRNSAAKANVALTPDQINRGIPAAVSSANLAAANTALAILAGALKTPGVPEKVYNQVLADLKVTPAQAAAITSRNNQNVNTVLQNPTNTILLQQSLLAQAGSLQIPAAAAVPAIAQATQTIVSGLPYNTAAELNAQATAAFTAQPATKPHAAQLANQATQFVNNEITAPNLNAPLNPGTISPNQLPASLPPETVATALKAPTLRAFRDYLASQLVANGLSFSEAQTQAQNTVLNINQQNNPALPYAPANVNQEVLQASLASSLNNVVKNPVATAASVTNAALNTAPPPATPEILRSNIATALLQSQIRAEVANQAAASAFITTQRTSPNNEEANKEAIKSEIAESLQRQSSVNHEEIAEDVADALLSRHTSIRDLVRFNILNPNPPSQEQVPAVAEPMYKQIQDTLNTKQVVFDSTDAAALTANVMKGNPNFGVSRGDPIEFPIQENTRA